MANGQSAASQLSSIGRIPSTQVFEFLWLAGESLGVVAAIGAELGPEQARP
jgi:hypothetical protein